MGVLKRFWKDESGATAIEYALVAALIAVATVVAVREAGVGINDTLTTLAENME